MGFQLGLKSQSWIIALSNQISLNLLLGSFIGSMSERRYHWDKMTFYDIAKITLVRSSRWGMITLLVFPSLQEREEWRRWSVVISFTWWWCISIKQLLYWSVDQYNNVQKSGSGDRMSGKEGILNITFLQISYFHLCRAPVLPFSFWHSHWACSCQYPKNRGVEYAKL